MKKIIHKTVGYAISSMMAAGAFADAHQTDSGITKAPETSLKNLKSLTTEVNKQQVYTLLSHNSHESHGSHESHSSHSSYGGNNLIQLDDAEQIALDESTNSTRNEASTPRSTVLPSSPAIVKNKKLKILPGNSAKFKEIVAKVQIALSAKGYDVGSIDGQYHARTIAALYEYQGRSGLEATGKLSPDTLSSLGIVAG